jgi:hypothetical protein
MSDEGKPKFEAGATMQIDLDQVQLVDLNLPGKDAAMSAARKTPPPLPALPPEVLHQAAAPAGSAAVSRPPASTTPMVRSVGPAPQPDSKKNVLYVGIIVVVVVVAIAAGLAVGRSVGGSSAAAPSASAGPSPRASGPVLTLPPIEVK